jgi:hypothetical protein
VHQLGFDSSEDELIININVASNFRYPVNEVRFKEYARQGVFFRRA